MLHKIFPEGEFGHEDIVRTAEIPEIFGGVGATFRPWHDVILLNLEGTPANPAGERIFKGTFPDNALLLRHQRGDHFTNGKQLVAQLIAEGEKLVYGFVRYID